MEIKVVCVRYKFSTKFGKWLAIKMAENGLGSEDVAKMLYTSRQAVHNHLHKPVTMAIAMSYAYIFRYADAYELYEMSREESE